MGMERRESIRRELEEVNEQIRTALEARLYPRVEELAKRARQLEGRLVMVESDGKPRNLIGRRTVRG
jgi:hypothetical protein